MIAKDHLNYKKIAEMLLDPVTKIEEVLELSDLTKAFVTWSSGKLRMEENSKIFYGDVRINECLELRLVQMILAGEGEAATASLIAFLEKLYQNPSKTAVTELYSFLNACSLPITKDGNFLAYKKVRGDYKDIYSNTFDNSVGKTLEVPRYSVDEDRERTCSNGLHCASFNYMSHYSSRDETDRIVIVSVNPKDVVTVPADYDNQKMRVCAYTVVDEIPNDGFTQIMDWLCGDREEGWIRTTSNKIQELLKKHLDDPDLDFTINDNFEECMNEAQWLAFIREVTYEFKLEAPQDGFFRENFLENYEGTVAGILKFISEWTL